MARFLSRATSRSIPTHSWRTLGITLLAAFCLMLACATVADAKKVLLNDDNKDNDIHHRQFADDGLGEANGSGGDSPFNGRLRHLRHLVKDAIASDLTPLHQGLSDKPTAPASAVISTAFLNRVLAEIASFINGIGTTIVIPAQEEQYYGCDPIHFDQLNVEDITVSTVSPNKVVILVEGLTLNVPKTGMYVKALVTCRGHLTAFVEGGSLTIDVLLGNDGNGHLNATAHVSQPTFKKITINHDFDSAMCKVADWIIDKLIGGINAKIEGALKEQLPAKLTPAITDALNKTFAKLPLHFVGAPAVTPDGLTVTVDVLASLDPNTLRFLETESGASDELKVLVDPRRRSQHASALLNARPVASHQSDSLDSFIDMATEPAPARNQRAIVTSRLKDETMAAAIMGVLRESADESDGAHARGALNDLGIAVPQDSVNTLFKVANAKGLIHYTYILESTTGQMMKDLIPAAYKACPDCRIVLGFSTDKETDEGAPRIVFTNGNVEVSVQHLSVAFSGLSANGTLVPLFVVGSNVVTTLDGMCIRLVDKGVSNLYFQLALNSLTAKVDSSSIGPLPTVDALLKLLEDAMQKYGIPAFNKHFTGYDFPPMFTNMRVASADGLFAIGTDLVLPPIAEEGSGAIFAGELLE